MDDDLEAAWAEVHAALDLMPGWPTGRPWPMHGGTWQMYAWNRRAKVRVGHRLEEWTAVGPTEVDCVREMARWLREIGEGRVPK